MVMQLAQSKIAVLSQNEIGEGPVWDAARGRILWVDHVTGLISQAQPEGIGRWRRIDTSAAAHPPLAAIIPRKSGGWVLVKHTEVLLMDEQGHLSCFARLEEEQARRVRWCDAKCDVAGRIWISGFAVDQAPSEGLYSIDAEGRVKAWSLGTRLGNGLEWSPDGRTMYFVDSLGPSILALDFDPEQATVSHARVLIPLALGQGGPNGLAVDREGQLWVAMTGGGCVQVYSPKGDLLARLPTLALPTSCAFGGSEGDHLFVTTRRGKLPQFIMEQGIVRKDRMQDDSAEAGALCVCNPGVTGAPPNLFPG